MNGFVLRDKLNS